MDGQSTQPRKAQLDKEEREHLEDVVTEMRDRVEANVRYQLEDEYNLNEKPDDDASLSEEQEDLVEAIELEAVDGNDWDDGYEQYITGVGFTIVNRLAALRCMEVRDFVDNEVTAFRDDGLTPAADRLVTEEFMLEEEAVLEAYRNACDDLAEEIEILFDRSTAYSLIDPDDDTFEDICGMLDEVADEVWRGDDVLGWVYEYYNHSKLTELRDKAHNQGLDPSDVAPANQFYTPHWVVRMLTDNSLGRIYVEDSNTELENIQESLTPEERKHRPTSFDESPDVASLCTYMVPAEEGEPTSFDDPSDIRVIDPACGSGHFLLYAFDVLERIWRESDTDASPEEVPAKILQHNLYGVDLDLRACQLAAFNLYLKARSRAESEGADDFELPDIGIVCADAKVADVEAATEVFDEVAADQPDVRDTLEQILEEFQDIHGLGSLLDVKGTLSEDFLREQTKITDSWSGPRSLTAFLKQLHEAVGEHHDDDSFLAQDLRSFLRLLVVLSQEYDVALMNPPYGARNRMPDDVTDYVEEHYEYGPEYYINFFEVCDNLTKENGRVGMIVQRSFMFKSSFQDFREDFIGKLGVFDFLAEYGNDVLDNATVRTAGTVVRTGSQVSEDAEGLFYRLHDLNAAEKESGFLRAAFNSSESQDVQREYKKELSEFSSIPGTPLSYWASPKLRSLYNADTVFDANNAGVDRNSAGVVKEGLTSGNNSRFLRKFWESNGEGWRPFAKGGEDAWTLPHLNLMIDWEDSGKKVKRYGSSYVRNDDYYGREALTYTYLKEGGRRFGYLNQGSVFGHAGKIFIPEGDIWSLLGYANSHLLTYLMLCQTPERHWEVGNVAKLPWPDELAEASQLTNKAERIAGAILRKRQYDLTSPHYNHPPLIGDLDAGWVPSIHEDHPYRQLSETIELPSEAENASAEMTLEELAIAHDRRQEELSKQMEETASEIEGSILQELNLGDQERNEIFTELALRTNDDPRETPDFNPEKIDEPSEEYPQYVKDLLLHFTVKALEDDNDGIIPLVDGSQETLLERIESYFENTFGHYAEDRLAEVDRLLGAQSPEEEAYPNLRAWLQEDLFNYHIDRFDNRPVFWKMTTKRLVSDPTGEGFACIVGFHQLDTGLFDRLENRYLEPRRADLRERQESANQRQNDQSLSASERARATEEYERCVSGREQINEFEQVLQTLASDNPRDWDEQQRKTASQLEDQVRKFREATEKRLNALDELRKEKEDDWFEDTFSPTFWSSIQENREEWIDALHDLEKACRAYSKPADEPIKAHLYDLLLYFDDLIGSDHYSSNGVLFMTYYFEREGKQFLDEDGEPKDGLKDTYVKKLATLASGLEEYKESAEEINENCQSLAKALPSDWESRALSEVTTAGYQPNQKHGVAINITPLAEKDIVPEVVEDKVL
ncbi:BREX-5 system adenine-specific DNA-methyltransferase PglX [Natrialbaceae archaeon A-arb3/5]